MWAMEKKTKKLKEIDNDLEIENPQWFFAYHSWSNRDLEILVFEEKGKPECLEKKLLKARTEPMTNSTRKRHRRRGLNPGHIGGKRVVSTLHHPSSLKAVNDTTLYSVVL